MKKIFRRLKIVEQIMIVMFFAILIPMITSGFIINNVNQHSVRKQLVYSTSMIAEVIAKNIDTFFDAVNSQLDNVALAIESMPKRNIYSYIATVNQKNTELGNITIEPASAFGHKISSDKGYFYDEENRLVIMYRKISNNLYLVSKIDRQIFEAKVFEIIKNDERQVYILNKNKELVIANNFSKDEFDRAISDLPHWLAADKAKIFGKIKNQPLAYFRTTNPDLIVVVNTTEKITDTTINIARYKIILAIVVSVLFIFGGLLLYTSYLYVNIRQLFKGIMALSKGNYKRKIRLLKNAFTPFELVFLSNEFNAMAEEINAAYRKLISKNRKLRYLAEFRSNLVDTVSHEFRTPLTSIKGYTSRLLRTDIEIDEETRLKSLKIIKNQSERLSRMVEDLLVIPDIEGAGLNISIDKIDILKAVNSAMLSLKDVENSNIKLNAPQEKIFVLADKDRLEQVLINLFENAKKYAYAGTDIQVNIQKYKKYAEVAVENSADYVEKELLETLFEKFTRVDDKTTRTTRGTGLGLFIVKGLVEAMDGKVSIHSSHENKFTAKITLPIANE